MDTLGFYSKYFNTFLLVLAVQCINELHSTEL